MRTTSNPAFRNLPTSGGYATFDNARPGGYPQAQELDSGRPITIDDVVTKTGISLGVLIAAGAVTWAMRLDFLVLPALVIGVVLALVNAFKRNPSPPLVIGYAVAMGVVLGAISRMFESAFSGIVVQAVVGTVAVFVGMLVVYRTGAIRVTPRLTRWIIGATFGAVALMLVNLIAAWVGGGSGLGLRDGSPIAIIFSLVCIGIAAFSFLLDFDAADQAIREQLPAKYAWLIAFGLLATLIWLYIEILRLLSYFRE